MKKTLILLSVAALAVFASCNKEGSQDSLTLVSAPTEVIPLEGTENPLEIVFNATKPWKASLNAEVAGIVNITPASGEAGDNVKVKLTVPANDAEADRTIVVTIKSEGLEPLVVTLKQNGLPHLIIETLEYSVTKEGGEFSIVVDANVEYTIKDYSDGSFPWQHAEAATGSNVVKVTIDANTDYASRQSYVKFTTSEIQDPVVDEEGNPTGEFVDHTERVYFNQSGLAETAWTVNLPETMKNGVQLSIAKFAGAYLLYDGVSAPVTFNPATGEVAAAPIDLSQFGITVAEILNDDAGNLLVATKTSYGSAFDVFVIPAGTATPVATPVIHAYFDYYGYGLGHFDARGNVLGDGIVTALIADGPSAGIPVTGAYWEIKEGKATTWAPYSDTQEPTCQPAYITFTTASEVWLTNRAAFAPLGTDAASGFLYNGYDGSYSLQYFVGGVTSPLTTIGDWANGVSCIKSGTWGSKNVVAVNNMAWFPQWAMPSNLVLFDATSMAPIVTFNILQEGLEASYMAEPSTCVLFEEDGGSLVIYSVDGAQGLIQKFVVPTK